MEIPNLVRQSLGGEEIEAGVKLGDEDLICLTPTRTLLYRAEGLLSDEKVEEYPHEIERLDVKEGRRKTKFVVEYVDGTRSFSVPSNRDTQALELFMTGVLRGADVTDPDESVVGAFRFSELALVVTEGRVVKHIGSSVWSADYEVYDFADLTGLRFERASVATEVILEIGGRPQRIKTPNERARKVQQVVENAVFEYYGVDSLDALNDRIADDDTAGDASGTGSTSDDLGLGGGIDPLVADDEDEAGDGGSADAAPEPTTTASDSSRSSSRSGEATGADSRRSTTATRTADAVPGSVDSAEVDAMREQLDELTAAVRAQGEQLERQQQLIEQLISELRDGR
jgi:hypothetical protein